MVCKGEEGCRCAAGWHGAEEGAGPAACRSRKRTRGEWVSLAAVEDKESGSSGEIQLEKGVEEESATGGDERMEESELQEGEKTSVGSVIVTKEDEGELGGWQAEEEMSEGTKGKKFVKQMKELDTLISGGEANFAWNKASYAIAKMKDRDYNMIIGLYHGAITRKGDSFVVEEDAMYTLLCKYDKKEVKKDEIMSWSQEPAAEKFKQLFGVSMVDLMTGKAACGGSEQGTGPVDAKKNAKAQRKPMEKVSAKSEVEQSAALNGAVMREMLSEMARVKGLRVVNNGAGKAHIQLAAMHAEQVGDIDTAERVEVGSAVTKWLHSMGIMVLQLGERQGALNSDL